MAKSKSKKDRKSKDKKNKKASKQKNKELAETLENVDSKIADQLATLRQTMSKLKKQGA